MSEPRKIIATLGESKLYGIAVNQFTNGDLVIRVGESDYGIRLVASYGWTFEFPEPPKPELPTEPGYYRDRKGDPWKLANNGYWYDQGYINGSHATRRLVDSRAPYVPLYTVGQAASIISDQLKEEDVTPWHVIDRLKNWEGLE